MRGTHHRLVAASLWPAVAGSAGVPPWQVALGIPLAVAFSAGVTSPDVDNTRTWKKLDKGIEDEVLGDGGPLGHRELMHWWGLPATVAAVLWVGYFGAAEFVLWAALVGWGSHIAADAVFGVAGFGTRAGVPVFPWGSARVAVGFRSDGIASTLCVGPACVVLWWVAFGLPFR